MVSLERVLEAGPAAERTHRGRTQAQASTSHAYLEVVVLLTRQRGSVVILYVLAEECLLLRALDTLGVAPLHLSQPRVELLALAIRVSLSDDAAGAVLPVGNLASTGVAPAIPLFAAVPLAVLVASLPSAVLVAVSPVRLVRLASMAPLAAVLAVVAVLAVAAVAPRVVARVSGVALSLPAPALFPAPPAFAAVLAARVAAVAALATAALLPVVLAVLARRATFALALVPAPALPRIALRLLRALPLALCHLLLRPRLCFRLRLHASLVLLDQRRHPFARRRVHAAAAELHRAGRRGRAPAPAPPFPRPTVGKRPRADLPPAAGPPAPHAVWRGARPLPHAAHARPRARAH